MVTLKMIEKIVRGCRIAMRKSDENKSQDINEYDEIYGDLLDCIYMMMGETTQTVEESITYNVMHGSTTDKECAYVLHHLIQAREYLACPPAFEFGNHMTAGYPAKAGG